MTKPTDVIRRVARDHPDLADPVDLVPFVLEDLAGQEQELLRRLLPNYIAQVLRPKTSSIDDKLRWQAFLSERIPTQDGKKFLRDASAEDLEAGVERRRRFAGALDGRAELFASTARTMREHSARVVGDLTLELAHDVLARLRLEARNLQTRRLGLARRTRDLGVLRTCVERLRELVDSGKDPREPMLRNYRDALILERDKLRLALERGRKTDEVMSRGTR